jgi:phosphate-selective porin OprO and OprP
MFMIAYLIVFLLSNLVQANNIVLPEASFDKNDGLVFEHDPSSFVMKTRFRIQTRATYEDIDSANTNKQDLIDFTVRRMRLRFDGTALDPRFLYKIQLAFTKDDMDFENSDVPTSVRDAVLGWAFTEKSTLWIGQTKIPGNRQRVVSSSNQELVDRSLVNSIFNIDRDMGIQLHHQFFDEQPFWFKVAVTNGEGRANNNRNTGLSYTGRLEWLPLGAFTNGGDYFEGDLARESELKVSLGASYNKNQKTNRLGGQTGKTFDGTLTRNMETLLTDILLKWNGWAWSSEFAKRWANDPFVTIEGSPDTIFKGLGYTTQLSYIFHNNWSPVIRYTQVTPETEILSLENRVTQYTVGLTKYLDKHKIKFLGDITLEHEENSKRAIDRQNWIARLQLEFGI